MQHAYDTRLKRDVAIKCIKIPSDPKPKSKSQGRKASNLRGRRYSRIPFGMGGLNDADSGNTHVIDIVDSEIPQDGNLTQAFVPLSTKISEPRFLAKRDRNARRRADRRSAAQPDPRPGIDAQDLHADDIQYPEGNDGRYGKSSGAGKVLYNDGVVNLDISSLDATRDFYAIGTSEPAEYPARNASAVIFRDSEEEFEDGILEAEPIGVVEDPLARVESIPGLEEARTAAHLNDVNIVTVYDCVVEGDTAYVIMEYVEGKTLSRIMKDLGNDITLDMVANVFASVSHALETAHNSNVLHLDIKPENVIINGEGIVKVTDFGLSTLMDSTGHGQTGGGTIGYMPLEQMRQQRLDVRTDEWALASLTYEMLSGKNPFKARNLNDAEAAIENADLVLPSACWDGVSTKMDDIMFCALSPDMEGRYGSVEEFSDALGPLLGDTREGKKQLAKAVENADLMRSDPESRTAPKAKASVPFIDRLGAKGAGIAMRAFSVLGIAMVAFVALKGFGDFPAAVPFAEGSDYGLGGMFAAFTVFAWIIFGIIVVTAAIFPRYAMLAAYLLFGIMLVYDGAYIAGFILLVATAAWWWLFGRQSDLMCTLVSIQPLFGSFGFAPIAPVAAGALLDVKDAVCAVAMMSMSAIMFASVGYGSIMGWWISEESVAVVGYPQIAQIINGNLISLVSSLGTWTLVAGWFAGAASYSALCRRGTRLFDIIGAVLCSLLIIAGTIIVPLAVGTAGISITPLVIAGLAVATVVAVLFALMSITDRVRMAPGEW